MFIYAFIFILILINIQLTPLYKKVISRNVVMNRLKFTADHSGRNSGYNPDYGFTNELRITDTVAASSLKTSLVIFVFTFDLIMVD